LFDLIIESQINVGINLVTI